MSKKLLIDSLSKDTTSLQLEDTFATCGDVIEARVVTHRRGALGGVGFVTFRSEQGATRAIQALDGATLDGQTIRVERASERRGDTRRSTGNW